MGQYFSAPIKRNEFEFFIVLCTKYDYVKNLIQHQITSQLLIDASRMVIQKLLSTIISFFQFLLAFLIRKVII